MAYCWRCEAKKDSWNFVLFGFDIMDDAQLMTVWQQRQFPPGRRRCPGRWPSLMKRKLARRVRQLSRLAEAWDQLLPQSIRDHTALEGFQNGVLTVLVDSSAHRFQLQTLLNAGLLAQLPGAPAPAAEQGPPGARTVFLDRHLRPAQIRILTNSKPRVTEPRIKTNPCESHNVKRS